MRTHTALTTRKVPLAYESAVPDRVLADTLGTQPNAKAP